MAKIAAVTMVYNEPEFLPIWLAHYARQVGAENCFVMDHGSDDGSTADLAPASLIRLPRSIRDEWARSEFTSDFCSGLLRYYDVVVHSDCDELLVADPRYHATLADCAGSGLPVTTAIGLNVFHDPAREPEYDPARPISAQRPWLCFVASMCKPVMITQPLRWQAGLHSYDGPIAFGRLFLFHLRHFDLQAGLRRLRVTRTIQTTDPDGQWYHRMDDEAFTANLHHIHDTMAHDDTVSLEPSEPPLAPILDRILAEQGSRAGEFYRLDLGLNGTALWRLPERFVGTF